LSFERYGILVRANAAESQSIIRWHSAPWGDHSTRQRTPVARFLAQQAQPIISNSSREILLGICEELSATHLDDIAAHFDVKKLRFVNVIPDELTQLLRFVWNPIEMALHGNLSSLHFAFMEQGLVENATRMIVPNVLVGIAAAIFQAYCAKPSTASAGQSVASIVIMKG